MDSELLFGTSPAMREVLAACRKYAVAIAPILILGDTGVGKTSLAKHLHGLSRRSGAFITHPLTSPAEQLEPSAIRGHTRGAFTGAIVDKIGVIEAARGGTLLLDELGLASPAIQEMLLDLVENRAVTRMGEVRPRPVDTWIISATNVDLVKAVETGQFRRDLLARFGYCRIQLPGLAERRDEILPLVRYHLDAVSRQMGRPAPALSPTLQALLQDAPWPDNLRQVGTVCQYLAIFAEPGQRLEPADLPRDFLVEVGLEKELRVRKADSEAVRRAIEEQGGHQGRAALALGISRRQLQRVLARTRTST